jgi:hypothetical protein
VKIIEKKCPNCGAGLSFGEDDTSCKCEYCHRAFEIERDRDMFNDANIDDFDAYSLIGTGLKAFSMTTAGVIIFMIAVFVLFIIFFINIASDHSGDTPSGGGSPVVENTPTPTPVPTVSVVKHVKEISNTDLKLLRSKAYGFDDVKGERSSTYSYNNKDDEIVRTIVAYKNDTNFTYLVIRVLYINFFDQDDKKSVFIPVRYKNVKPNLGYTDDEILDSMKIDAPRYYLNGKKSTYIRGGYASYKKFFNEKIEPLKKKGFKVTVKK